MLKKKTIKKQIYELLIEKKNDRNKNVVECFKLIKFYISFLKIFI